MTNGHVLSLSLSLPRLRSSALCSYSLVSFGVQLPESALCLHTLHGARRIRIRPSVCYSLSNAQPTIIYYLTRTAYGRARAVAIVAYVQQAKANGNRMREHGSHFDGDCLPFLFALLAWRFRNENWSNRKELRIQPKPNRTNVASTSHKVETHFDRAQQSHWPLRSTHNNVSSRLAWARGLQKCAVV